MRVRDGGWSGHVQWCMMSNDQWWDEGGNECGGSRDGCRSGGDGLVNILLDIIADKTVV